MAQGKCCAVIVAAGSGRRMGTAQKKQYLLLQGKPILEHTLQVFQSAEAVDLMVLVVGEEDVPQAQQYAAEYSKLSKVIAGGRERIDSVRNGLAAVPETTEVVLIHDGVRPFVQPALIEAVVKTVREKGACIPAIPVKDTIKQVDEAGVIENTPHRKKLWQAQTPQGFLLPLIRAAYGQVPQGELTDDASLLELQGKKVHIVPGSEENIKITTPWDLKVAELILRERGEA